VPFEGSRADVVVAGRDPPAVPWVTVEGPAVKKIDPPFMS
jgi:hypothetical protein